MEDPAGAVDSDWTVASTPSNTSGSSWNWARLMERSFGFGLLVLAIRRVDPSVTFTTGC